MADRSEIVAVMAAIIYASRTSQAAASVSRTIEDDVAREAWHLLDAVQRFQSERLGRT